MPLSPTAPLSPLSPCRKPLRVHSERGACVIDSVTALAIKNTFSPAEDVYQFVATPFACVSLNAPLTELEPPFISGASGGLFLSTVAFPFKLSFAKPA